MILGFKKFHVSQRTLVGIKAMAMTKKGQTKMKAGDDRSRAEKFYSLVV